MITLNRVILMGYLGKDPEYEEYDNGAKKAVLRLATTERGYKSKSGAQIPDRTEWHTVVFWERMAELVKRTLHKGSCIYVEGRLTTKKWEKEGQEAKFFTEIIGNHLIFLDKWESGTSTQENVLSAGNSLQNGKFGQSTNDTDDDMPF